MLKHTPSVLQTKAHTPKPQWSLTATVLHAPHLWTPPNFLLSERTSVKNSLAFGEGVYTVQGPGVPHSRLFWGETLHLLPVHGAPPPVVCMWGLGGLRLNLRVRMGVGEGRGGGGGSSKRDTKRRPSAWLHGAAGAGERASNTSHLQGSRDLSGHAPATPHLGPAYLGWGRGDAAAGGLGAVSVFLSPARGAQGTTIMGRDAKGVGRGSIARVPALWGSRGFLLVRGISCCSRVPRFGVSVYRSWGRAGVP
jgi:hypothetical protein